MAVATREARDLDLKSIEGCLMEHPDVIDASVWWSSGELCAHVTVYETHRCDVVDLQAACRERLGLHQTPRSITMLAARPWAA